MQEVTGKTQCDIKAVSFQSQRFLYSGRITPCSPQFHSLSTFCRSTLRRSVNLHKERGCFAKKKKKINCGKQFFQPFVFFEFDIKQSWFLAAAIYFIFMKEYGTVYEVFHISKAVCLILDSESWLCCYWHLRQVMMPLWDGMLVYRLIMPPVTKLLVYTYMLCSQETYLPEGKNVLL